MNTNTIIYLAPIRGITDHIFRQALFTHCAGFDAAIAPFVKTSQKTVTSATFGRLTFEQQGVRIIPQLLGRNADDFLRYASVLRDMGAESVNWNLGCPHPVVTKKRLGSGLLPHPDHIDQFLEKVCPRLPLPLSIKLRLGLDDPLQAQRLLPILNNYPLQEVLIHPRLGIQHYEGTVDLEHCAQFISACAHRVVYNGDLNSYADHLRLQERFPTVQRWMLGRGAISNPMLAQQIKTGASTEGMRTRLRAIHDQCYAAYRDKLSGDAHLLSKMRQLWEYWHNALELQPRQLKALKKVKCVADYERLVQHWW